jgi:hypothetical protein
MSHGTMGETGTVPNNSGDTQILPSWSASGQSLHFDPVPLTSGLPRHPINGHHRTDPVGPFRAISGSDKPYVAMWEHETGQP